MRTGNGLNQYHAWVPENLGVYSDVPNLNTTLVTGPVCEWDNCQRGRYLECKKGKFVKWYCKLHADLFWYKHHNPRNYKGQAA